MTVPAARRWARWLLHPATFAAALALACVLGAMSAFRPYPAIWPTLVLAAVAGAAAGFANSGST